MTLNFRECNECNVCCDGSLMGNSHGNKFGNKKPCVFLVTNKCSIYKDRPNSCKSFQCAWSQKLLPEWMRPDKCGVLVSIENDINKQYLKVVETKPLVEYEIYKEIQTFCDKNNTYYVKVPYETNSRFS
jgi:hypothetical protein